MWTWALQLLGVGLPAIIKEIAKARQDRLNADTEDKRIAADERIEILTARKEIILQAQKDKYERWIRIAFAIPFILYVWKLIVWDKLLEWGTTDPLSPTLEYILWTVLGAYFLDVGIKRFRGN